jgi:hypothetical protein
VSKLGIFKLVLATSAVLAGISLHPVKALAQEYPPSTGTLVGSRDGDLLNFECKPIDPMRITCDFVQVILTTKSNNEKLKESLEGIPDFLQKLKTKENFCPVFEARKMILNGEKVSDPELAAEAQRMIDEERRTKAGLVPENLARAEKFFSAIEKLCAERSAEAAKEMILLAHESGLETCEPVFNKYTEVFVKVDASLWVVESSPTGVCGIVNTSRLFSDPKYSFLWNYQASKVITNKNGTDIVPCSGLDERPQIYNWNQAAVYKNCKFLE